MAVPIDGISVIIANAVVEERFPGGLAAYERDCPNATYCSDGQICRVAFMVEADARAFVERLTSHGFTTPWSSESSDIALVGQHVNRLYPCDWLTVDLLPIVTADGRQSGATVAWFRGETPDMVAAPAGWTPGAIQFVSAADFQNSYEFVEAKSGDGGGGLETYRHRETGALIHIGRPQIATAPSVQARFMELCNELKELEERRPLTAGRQQALTSFFERTAQLVKDTHAQEPGPLLLHGVAARFVKRWKVAAESARAVTVLRPDLMEGWLDQTWALAEMERFEEAESCAHEAVALDPTNAQALGNLASVLLQRDKVEEAFATITRALQSDPTNSKNQLIRERILEARDQVSPETPEPWYRKLWRR